MNVTYIAISEKDWNALKQPDRFLSAKSAAALIDSGEDLIREMAKDGIINTYKIPGRSITRYKESEILRQFKPL